MSVLIGYAWSILMDALLINIFRKKFEEVMPLAYITGGFCLFLFGLFEHISYGYYFSLILCVISFLWILYLYIKDKEGFKAFLQRFFTIGFVAFTVMFLFIFFLQRNRGFSIADEFWNWGLQVREDFRLDSFISEESRYANRAYPPFLTIIELLFCYFGGAFQEGYCYRGLTTFCLSLYLPLLGCFDIRKKKDWIRTLIYVLVFFLLGICISVTVTDGDYPHIYNTIYVDFPMGLFSAYCFYQVYTQKRWEVFTLVNTVLSITVLLLLKQTGMAFAAMVIVFLIFLVIRDSQEKKKIDKKKLFLTIGLIIGIPLLVYGGWSVYAYLQGNSANTLDMLSSEKVRNFFLYLTDPTQEKHQVILNYVDVFLHRPLVLQPLSFSFFTYSIFISVILFLILFFLYRDKASAFALSLIYYLGSLAYAAARIFLFLTIYNEHQGTYFVSYDRYMKSYLYIGTILAFMLVMKKMAEEQENKKAALKTAAVLLCTCLFVEPANLNELVPSDKYTGYNNERMGWILNMLESTEEGSRFFFVEQYIFDQGRQDVLDYVLLDSSYDVDVYTLGPDTWDGQQSMDISVEEYLELLKNYDYLFLIYPDEVYAEKYWETTTDEPLINQRLFHIDEVTEDGVELTIVGDFPVGFDIIDKRVK